MIGVVEDTRPAIIVGAVWVVLLVISYRWFVSSRGTQRREIVDETGRPDTGALGVTGPESRRPGTLLPG